MLVNFSKHPETKFSIKQLVLISRLSSNVYYMYQMLIYEYTVYLAVIIYGGPFMSLCI